LKQDIEFKIILVASLIRQFLSFKLLDVHAQRLSMAKNLQCAIETFSGALDQGPQEHISYENQYSIVIPTEYYDMTPPARF
jgi:xanthine dehydrogenase molybdopterin-binding subunit B